MANPAVLLVNLGSPDTTDVPNVRRYLDEFLSDDRVLDGPKLLQQFVLKALILPRRPPRTAHAYRRIWSPEGSPLLVISRRVQALLQHRLELPVFLAMRYGRPGIPAVMQRLAQEQVDELFLVPLYPHYAMSSYETVVARVHEVAREKSPAMRITTLQPFYDDPDYIEALYQNAVPDLERGFDHLLFSYHGIPERHLRKADSSHAHCLLVNDCCRTCSPVQATCYRAQTIRTTEAFVRRASLPEGRWSISYQSRLGREPWLHPYTDHELPRLAATGVRRLLVMCPSFVSDCLETLEEIALTGRDSFLAAGGTEFKQIPCLNEHPAWIAFLEKQVRDWLGQRESTRPSAATVPVS